MLVKMKYARKLLEKQVGQRDDWSTFKETSKGKMYERHAAKIATSTVRLGRCITLNQLSTVPENRQEGDLLGKLEDQIRTERERAGKLSSTKLERLLAAEKVLRITQSLKLRTEGRPPTVFQVAAYTALLHGLDSSELKGTVTRMNNISRRLKSMQTWKGYASSVYEVIYKRAFAHRDYPSSILTILLERKGQMMSHEIAKELQGDPDINNIVNTSMQLLEAMGHVKKLPPTTEKRMESRSKAGPQTVWISREYKPSLDKYSFSKDGKLHYYNPCMEILNNLAEGPAEISTLCKVTKIRPHCSTNAIYDTTTVYRTVERLKESGLVQIKETVKVYSNIAEVLELTKLGTKMWARAVETGTLPEELIKLLIGEKETNIREVLRK